MIWFLCSVLAYAYKANTPLLMQTNSDSADSLMDYIDNTQLTEETQQQAEANAAAKSYDNGDSSKLNEDETTQTGKHNRQAETVQAPGVNAIFSEDYRRQKERVVEAEQESVEYSSSITDSVHSLAIETNKLMKENGSRRRDNKILKDIYDDTEEKLNRTRIYNSRDKTAYQREINEESAQREQLTKEANEPEEDEDSQEQPELEASSEMTFAIGVVFSFVFFQGAQFFLGSMLDSVLEPTLQALFADVTVLTLLWAVSYILFNADIFEKDAFDLEKVLVGLGVFVLVWLMLGLWLVFAAQSHSRKWMQLEDQCSDMRLLKNSYEEAYNDFVLGKANEEFQAMRDAMQYAVMRQEFIRPTYQVPVSELVLRSDFELSEYLSRCLAQTVDDCLQLSWLSYCILVLAVVIWRLVLLGSATTQFAFLVVVPVVMGALLWTLNTHLTQVYYELVPFILDPYEVHFMDNYSKEPLENVDKIPRPPYLRGKIPGLHESTEALGSHPLRLTCAYIFGGSLPNRHQTLFYFDSYGPKVITFCLQGSIIVAVLWLTVLALYYTKSLWYTIGWYSVLVLAASFCGWVWVYCVLLPECIRELCLTTKLEQMKDKAQFKAVVCKGKAERAIRAMRIYRKLKMIYREQNSYDETSISSDQQGLLIEVYELQAIIGGLHISALEDVVALLGFDLEEDELRIFAKECEPVKPR